MVEKNYGGLTFLDTFMVDTLEKLNKTFKIMYQNLTDPKIDGNQIIWFNGPVSWNQIFIYGGLDEKMGVQHEPLEIPSGVTIELVYNSLIFRQCCQCKCDML